MICKLFRFRPVLSLTSQSSKSSMSGHIGGELPEDWSLRVYLIEALPTDERGNRAFHERWSFIMMPELHLLITHHPTGYQWDYWLRLDVDDAERLSDVVEISSESSSGEDASPVE